LQLYRKQMRDDALERRQRLVDHQAAKIERLQQRRGLSRASADLERMLEDEHRMVEVRASERTGLWTGLAVGLGLTALIGLAGVVVYLLVRKKDGSVAGARVMADALSGTEIVERIMPAAGGIPEEVGGALRTIAQSLNRPSSRWNASVMKTYRLPSLNDRTRGAIRVAQATDAPYEAVIRTVGPAGGWAAFAYNATELNMSTAATVPVGDIIILPTFQWQILRLRPRDILYAKGASADTIISVTMSEMSPDGQIGRGLA
jgi:hypothetical protein